MTDYGFPIPEWLAEHRTLNPGPKLLFARLLDFASISQSNVAWPALERLSNDLGTPVRTLRDWVCELVKSGLLDVSPGRGRTPTHYILRVPDIEAQEDNGDSVRVAADKSVVVCGQPPTVVCGEPPVVCGIPSRSVRPAATTYTKTYTNTKPDAGDEIQNTLREENTRALQLLGVAKLELANLDGVTPDLIRWVAERSNQEPAHIALGLPRAAANAVKLRTRNEARARNEAAEQQKRDAHTADVVADRRRSAIAREIIDKHGGKEHPDVQAAHAGMPKGRNGEAYPFQVSLQAIANVLAPGEIARRMGTDEPGVPNKTKSEELF